MLLCVLGLKSCRMWPSQTDGEFRKTHKHYGRHIKCQVRGSGGRGSLSSSSSSSTCLCSLTVEVLLAWVRFEEFLHAQPWKAWCRPWLSRLPTGAAGAASVSIGGKTRLLATNLSTCLCCLTRPDCARRNRSYQSRAVFCWYCRSHTAPLKQICC
jgi:hypothetical protein